MVHIYHTAVLFAYFIGTQFVTMRATSFISLSHLSGQCIHQPLLVSGVYYLDSNGSWNEDTYYNANAAVYSLELRNFKKTAEEYSNEVKLQRLSFDQISLIETRNNLAYNLLYWIGWSEITFHENIDKSISTSRWQLTGDAKEILDNVGIAGSLSNVKNECQTKSAVDYNSITGRFVVTYETGKFIGDHSCRNITTLTKPDPLISRGNVDSITVAWDGVSLLIAAAVNEGILPISNLISVDDGYSNITDDAMYLVSRKVDVRYPKMDPIICFELRGSIDSTTFSAEITQIILGVDIHAANSNHGKSVLQDAINKAIFPSQSKVTINDITSFLSNPDKSNDNVSRPQEDIGEFSHRDESHRQNCSNITLIYTVIANNNDDILIVSDLVRESVRGGHFSLFLRKSGDERFLNARVTSDSLTIEHSSFSSSGDSHFNKESNSNINMEMNMNMRRGHKGTGAAAAASSGYSSSPFCLPFVNGNFAYPYFTHYGPAGTTDSYNQFTPQSCDCHHPTAHPTGESKWCHVFDFMVGLVIFDHQNSGQIQRFHNSVMNNGGIAHLVYNASFASATLSNGFPTTGLSAESTRALHTLNSTVWREGAYAFCTPFGCNGIIMVETYDTTGYSSPVNGAYHQIRKGSCHSSTNISSKSWATAQENPPTQLIASYFNCTHTLQENLITAIGVGAGIANAVIPIMILIVVYAFTHFSGIPQRRMIKDVYSADERERAICHLATHLLMVFSHMLVRDNDSENDILERDDTFVKNLFANSDMIRASLTAPPPVASSQKNRVYLASNS